MRRIADSQLPLLPNAINHVHARELAKISEILDGLPEVTALVYEDIMRREGKEVDPNKGRAGMTAEQVLRVLIVKQMNGFSYEELAFHLADSSTYRSFCRWGIEQAPLTKSTLQKNIKCVAAETWEAINRHLIRHAAMNGIETGKKARTDCTVVKSNIHHPMDSALLFDGVRVLTRLVRKARKELGAKATNPKRRMGRAKRLVLQIMNAKSKEMRVSPYGDLLKVTSKTVREAEHIAETLMGIQTRQAAELAEQLRHYIGLVKRVIDQTERRVLREEPVPAAEKIVSIFEPHTDIIVKDRRETLYGHKICLTSGASGLVTDVVIEEGNPGDSTLAVKMVDRHSELFGKVPRQVCFDGGFTSKSNLAAIKARGVQDVAFGKRRNLEICEMVKSTWVYRRLRDFRAGVEGTISFLKRAFGLDRCTWRGWGSFKAYVHGSTLACNLLIVARHMLSSSS